MLNPRVRQSFTTHSQTEVFHIHHILPGKEEEQFLQEPPVVKTLGHFYDDIHLRVNRVLSSLESTDANLMNLKVNVIKIFVQ